VTVSSVVLVAAGASTGSLLRYAVGQWLSATSSRFPWSTWLVNVVGSALLAVLVRMLAAYPENAAWYLFLGVGFCGGLTTFSTMSVETLRLGRTAPRLAAVYVMSSICTGCLLAAIFDTVI
jgi:CrcB protein